MRIIRTAAWRGIETASVHRNVWGASLQVAAAAAILLWAGNAAAKDETIVESEVTPPPKAAAAAPASDSDPAIQGYIEPSYGIAYMNLWSSNVDFGDDFRGAEIDVAAGLRPQFGPLSLNVGYVHYFYAPESVSPDYGEIFAKADYNFDDKFTIAARAFFAPDFSQSGHTATFVAGGVKVPLPNDFAVYGGIGYQFFEDEAAFEDLAWTAGVSYTWKQLTFDVRYWDTDLADNECVVRSGFEDGCDARIVGTISFDYTLSALRDRGSDPLKPLK
jgi:uncharacterized protein (TIGR02001 family)